MEDDEGDTTVGGEEPVIDKKIAGKQDGVALLHSDSNADKSNSPTPLVEENNRTKLECDDNRKSCGKIETSRTPSDSQNDSGTFISDSDVPNSPKKVNGEVELSKCDCAEQKSDANDSSGNVVKNNRIVEAETTNSEPENTRVLRKRKRQTSPSSDEIRDTDSGQNLESNVEFKGFKKRYLAQSAIATHNTSLSSDPPKPGSKCKKSSVKKTVPETQQHVLVSHQTLPDGTQSSAQLTEYVQYLGLQPTVKFKCYICGESGFPSILQLQKHQKVCLKTSNKKQTLVKPAPQTPTIEPSPSTNFRITRKVYLCSACGTYYENWNLFLHMREVHKRHICLFCLGMFSQADKLATHLSGKHAVVEGVYSSTDHFLSEFKGSYFLMCCTCERIFTERENFFDHSCSEGLVINADKACSLCGLRGAHFPTCRRAFTDSSASPPPPSSSVPATVENTSEPTQNSQLIQEPPQLSLSVTKYLIPVEKVADKKTNQKTNEMLDSTEEPQEKSRELSDIDDDYDISNAASFCHVNIHESQEKQKQAVTSKTKTYKGKREAVATEKPANESDPADVSSPSTNIDQNNVDSSDTIDNTKDENVQDKNVELDHKTDNEREPEESEEKVDKQEKADEQEKTEEQEKTDEQEKIDKEESDTVTEPANVEESAQKEDMEVEENKLEEEDKTELQNDEKDENRVTEEAESNVENDTKQTTEEEKESEPFLQTETDTQLSPKSEVSPKVSQQTDAKISSKTPSATEADSESESSESGEESDETSSSSEASSEESDRHEEAEEAKEKERIDGSDIENADSDKMSLVVDENRSEDDEEVESQKEKTDDVAKQISDGKVSETEETKQDEEPKSDSDSLPNVVEESEENKAMEDEKVEEPTESVQLAGDDVPLLELTLEENLDTMSIQMLLKESVKVSCLNCVYCNHAKKIAVNGKQLALHLLAEHRFAPVVCSDSGELTEVDGFVDRLKALLPELQQMFFNTDSYDNMDQTCMHPYDRTYECFHCHFVTTLHKELYVHNRKMHQKTILLCIMCKSNFYSYSELLCHLCPGIYVPESNISFRCCLCSVDGLPSAFRLMVHLRKRHHACDVCLETTGDQQKLSNHVWKHKLHHLCYRCGIAYRNKPDITKHLFWKHGTESVLCKKCLQKKWPHVYHFCIPPNAFVCEECNSSFSRAVALKVHKRLHAGDLPYSCSECEERFISRKLLTKHEEKHREPPPVESMETKLQENGPIDEIESQEKFQEGSTKTETESHEEADVLTHEDAASNGNSVKEEEESQTKTKDSLSEADIADTPAEPSVAESLDELARHEDKDTSEKKSKVVDVYDLPPLNLSSESDDSDDDDERKETQLNVKDKSPAIESPAVNEGAEVCDKEKIPESMPQLDDDVQQPIEVVDGIWDNFKTYKANLERRENQHIEIGESSTQKSETESCDKLFTEVLSVINMDHDYCGPPAGTSQSDEAVDHPEDMLATETGTTVQQVLAPMQDTGKTEEPKESTEDEKKACDADHNYCYTNTTSLSVEDEKEKDVPAATVETTSPSKKKQKSPKKKQKRSASSSSSDSSSNSDSSTCSCGTNCSCSSSSSSSSGSSSSQSSDSDSSSSEGRRRQAARRERRRERAKKRKVEETEDPPAQTETTEVAENGPSVQEEVPPPLPSVAEPEEVDVPIRESDLDTDETETDEDFYDKYPQRLANKLLAEKRNQLLMLAAVAPVNNGTMSQSGQSPPPSVIEEPVPKKKVKTKKHKKSQHQHSSSESKTENKLKLNIPSDYYSTQTPIFSKSTMPTTSASNSMNTTVLTTSSQAVPSPFLASQPEPSTPSAAYHSTGSGSETDSKRLSKRKRVPKRFYGDSSDEEPEQPPVKWRKVLPAASNSPATTPQQASGYTYKSTPVPVPEPVRVPTVPVPAPEEKSEEEAADDSDSDRDDVRKSSSESSNSESEADKEQDDDDVSDADSEVETPPPVQTSIVTATREGEGVQQRNENLYCYCQCPYDEVSEMIACDGKDCTIEWFHFECVGIMVPPKGKWFCPDCRKRAAARSEYLVHVG